MHRLGDDLTYPGGKLRLFVDSPLYASAVVTLSENQSHYLRHVMRAQSGDKVLLFNGSDGEWRAKVTLSGKKAVQATCEASLRPQRNEPDLWLLFAPIKRAPIDFVIEKATELGVAALQPVITRRTIVSRTNLTRLRSHAVEAAEQSERLTVPELREPVSLDRAFDNWDPTRRMMWCDESGKADPAAAILGGAPVSKAWAVLTGPEGGFDRDEQERLRHLSFAHPVSLGPRILRADTAALAALAVWQSVLGDWR